VLSHSSSSLFSSYNRSFRGFTTDKNNIAQANSIKHQRDLAGDSRDESRKIETDNPLGLEEDHHVPGYVNTSRSHNPNRNFQTDHHTDQHYEFESTSVSDHLKYMHKHEDLMEQKKDQRTGTQTSTDGTHGHGQGFASMPKEQVQEIRLKGRAARTGRSEEEEANLEQHNRDNRGSESHDRHGRDGTHGHGRGFAAMSKEQVQEIGIKGRAARTGRSEEEEANLEQNHRDRMAQSEARASDRGSSK